VRPDSTSTPSPGEANQPVAKPAALAPIFESIPEDLRPARRWVTWRWELRPDKGGKLKWTKPPYDARTGEAAKSNDSNTWSSFDEARAAVERGDLDGVGFVISQGDGIVAIDLDHVRDPANGELLPWAVELVASVDTYAEVSPSGTGVRILARGRKPGSRCKREVGGGPACVEMYEDGRYVTVTGRALDGARRTIEDRQAQIEDVYHRHLEAEPHRTKLAADATAPPRLLSDEEAEVRRTNFPDEFILRKAREAKNGDKFKKLWSGDTSMHDGDDSRADLALVSMLAWWTGPDAARIDALFRRSGLYRPKWDEPRPGGTYGTMTIDKALGGMTGYYLEAADGEKRNHGDPEPLEGPFGIRLTVRRSRRTRTKTTLDADLTIGGRRLKFNLSSSQSNLEESAREIAENLAPGLAVAGEARIAVKRFLRGVFAELEDCETSSSADLEQMVRREFARLRLTFTNNLSQLWSEAAGAWLYPRQVLERLPRPSLVKELKKLFPEAEQPADLAPLVRRVGETLVAEALQDLPEQGDAGDLGPDSAAAREARALILEVWSLPRTFERENRGTAPVASLARRAYLAVLAPEAAALGRWMRVHTAFDAWARARDGKLLLAMRDSLLRQCGRRLPGVHDYATFSELMVRYGLVEPTDARVGKVSTRARVLSADMTEELSAS
jgi:hypothetical protein